MSDFLILLSLAFLGSIVALFGGVIFLFKRSWSAFLEMYSIPFAAGVLLTVSVTGLMPEAVHMYGDGAYIIVLLSFLAVYLIEHTMFDIHHHESTAHKGHIKRSVVFVVIGDSIHNFVDGVAIAAAYIVSPGLGLITAISTFLHEVPHEIGDFGIMLKAGWSRRRVLLINALSASTTFLGVVFVVVFTSHEAVIGVLLAVAAGLFLYLGAIDFLPNIPEERHFGRAIVALLIGVAVMLVTLNSIPHSHDTHEDSAPTFAEDHRSIESYRNEIHGL